MVVANVRIYEFTCAIDKLINKHNLTNKKILQRSGWSQDTENSLLCSSKINQILNIALWYGPVNNKQQQQIKKH